MSDQHTIHTDGPHGHIILLDIQSRRWSGLQ